MSGGILGNAYLGYPGYEEVGTGFEPAFEGFANLCLTAWLPHRVHNDKDDERRSTSILPYTSNALSVPLQPGSQSGSHSVREDKGARDVTLRSPTAAESVCHHFLQCEVKPLERMLR